LCAGADAANFRINKYLEPTQKVCKYNMICKCLGMYIIMYIEKVMNVNRRFE